MQNPADKTTWAEPLPRRSFLNWHVSPGALLALGAAVSYTIINVTVVQPTAQQLSQLQAQVTALESSIRDLAGQRGVVAATNTLLGQLAEQGRLNEAASQSLDRISALHQRLNQQTERAQRALEVMEKLASLQDGLLQNAARVEQAAGVLGSMETLQTRLASQEYLTENGHRALDQLDALRGRLLERESKTATAQANLDAIDALQDRLTLENESNLAAAESLSALVALKDQTLSQTGNLAQATENLELMSDVRDQLAGVAQSFARMRHWISEILAFEPVFNRAMRSLQPLTELGNLRHLSATELRGVIRTLNERREPQWTGAAHEESAPAVESGASDAPTIESARAH